MSRIVILLAALVAVVGLVACEAADPEFTAQDQVPAELRDDDDVDAPDGEPAAPTGEVYTFVAVDIDYSDAPTEISAGTVTFELINEGAIVHDVAIEELGSEIVVAADGGETATGTVTLEPGTYTYYCTVPGHRAAGMEGEFTVVE